METGNWSNKGFTLISAIVACLILTIGVLAVINLFPSSATINAKADRLNEASILAEDRIESFRSMGYDSLQTLMGLGIVNGADTTGKFIRTWSFTQVNNTIQISVQCEWAPPGRTSLITQRVNFATLISDYE